MRVKFACVRIASGRRIRGDVVCMVGYGMSEREGNTVNGDGDNLVNLCMTAQDRGYAKLGVRLALVQQLSSQHRSWLTSDNSAGSRSSSPLLCR